MLRLAFDPFILNGNLMSTRGARASYDLGCHSCKI